MIGDNETRGSDAYRQAVEDEIDEALRLRGEDAGEVLLVRHAEPARNESPDPMLSCTGLQQAERLAARLSATWLQAVYSAPERRAQQTARVLACTGALPVHVLDGLADIEFEAVDGARREPPARMAEQSSLRKDARRGIVRQVRFRGMRPGGEEGSTVDADFSAPAASGPGRV